MLTAEHRSRLGRRNKRKGSDFELRVKRTFEKKRNAYVVKAGGSHGAADLIAIMPNLPEYPGSIAYLIQAKSGRGPDKAELAELHSAALLCAGIPVLATKAEGGDDRQHWVRCQKVVKYRHEDDYRLEPLWFWPLES